MLTSFLHSEVLGHLAHFSCYRSGYVSCSVQGKVIDFLYLVACVLNPEVIEGAFQNRKTRLFIPVYECSLGSNRRYLCVISKY